MIEKEKEYLTEMLLKAGAIGNAFVVAILTWTLLIDPSARGLAMVINEVAAVSCMAG